MTATAVGNAARKDLRRRLRDPAALLLWLGIPLVVGALLATMAGGRSGVRPTARVLVADHDQSTTSRLLARALDRAGGVIATEAVDEAAGRARVEAGEATALLVVPRGFGAALLAEKPTELKLVANPAQRILPGIVEEVLRMLADATFYAHRLVGPEIGELRAQLESPTAPDDGEIARLAVGVSHAVQRSGRYLLPPVVAVETEVIEEEGGPAGAGAVLFLPGIVVMALLFTAQGLAEDLWHEREGGTLRRAVSTPLGASGLLAGKLAAGAVVLAAVALVVLAAGMAYLELPPARLPLALAWALGSGLAFLAAMLVLQLLASTRRAANVLGNAIVFPLLMLGGSFFPSEAMPGWMAAASRFTPNGWALERLKDILLGRARPVPVAVGFVALALALGLLHAWCARRLRRRFATG